MNDNYLCKTSFHGLKVWATFRKTKYPSYEYYELHYDFLSRKEAWEFWERLKKTAMMAATLKSEKESYFIVEPLSYVEVEKLKDKYKEMFKEVIRKGKLNG